VQHSETKINDIADKPHELTHSLDSLRGFCIYRSRGSRKIEPQDDDAWYLEQEAKKFANNNMFDVYDKKEGDIFDVYDSGTGWY
jgi:hypothetical protein